MAFDFDEAIELRYDGNTYTANAYTANSFAFSTAAEEPIAFEVESFEAESFEAEPFAVQADLVPNEFYANASANAYDDPPYAPIAHHSVAPITQQPNYNFAVSQSQPATFSINPSDDEVSAFAADLQAILSGEKYQSPPPPEDPPYPPPPAHLGTAQSASPDQPEVQQPHTIFDQIAQNMAYANAYDLGTLSLEQRFDVFDRALDQGTPEPSIALTAATPAEPQLSPQWVKPFSIPESIAEAQSYDDAWSLPLDTDPTGLVENFGITSGSSGESFDMRYEVPLIPQQTGYSAWAAAAAMLVNWRDEIPLNLTELAQGTGAWAKYKPALQTEDGNFFKVWGLATKPAQTMTVDSFVQLVMDTFGPIWIASDPPGSHARVITGVYGDGTPEGTYVLINDPWKADMTTFQMPNTGAKYQETYQQFMKKQLAMTRQGTTATTLYVAYLQEPIGKALLAEVEANED
jgi:hypothetical protein